VSNGAAGSNFAAGAGVYYDPVKQLTVGLEASYTANTISYQTGLAATGVDLVTVFRF
jgi:opacity protein-like surface antigen